MNTLIAYKKNKNDKKFTVVNVEEMNPFEFFLAIANSSILDVENLTIAEVRLLLQLKPYLFDAYRLA